MEALKAHGFGAWRIYIQHIVVLNLRPVLVRQGAEAMMTVAFLRWRCLFGCRNQSSFTHSDNLRSWADLLKEGYLWLALGLDSSHVLFVGLGLLGLVVLTALLLPKRRRHDESID